ncbi:oocyte zinc finger protein XlCOF7.1-like [Acanthopagrus latus]|uniref:oocyte zinc finger protein XlCOF7.1-like n=1 Tax=Acanthopagrus latus TaxID=8177 RepID=UPI00187D09A8|nr:oocyte zinc finger protein XlCOF7.1-like [Acanthopagrus latus]XP_036946456.1 oocyte zinc finger protein XlCOF7.1-like [Acanthopagrus latus]
MSTLQALRASVNQRLTMAAEEIFELFERTMAAHKEELCRQFKLSDGAFKPEHQLHRADVQQLLVSTEAELPGQQEWSLSLAQKDPAEPPHIKEERELPTSQEEEQLHGLEETGMALTPVKSEVADEGKPQSTESYQRLTEEIQSKADAEDCGASEPARNSDPNGHLQSDTDDESSDFSGHGTDDSSDWEEQPEKSTPGTEDRQHDKRHTEHLKASQSDPETDDSCDWEESGSPPTSARQVPVRDMQCNSGKHLGSSSEVQPGGKSFSCSVCGKQYQWKTSLMVHMRLHSEGKRFRCSVCDKGFQFSVQIVRHMKTHAVEQVFNCSACGFVQTTTSAVASRSKRSACPICKVPVKGT